MMSNFWGCRCEIDTYEVRRAWNEKECDEQPADNALERIRLRLHCGQNLIDEGARHAAL